MFESAELDHQIDKKTYKREVAALHEVLIDKQYDLAEAKKCPVIILIGGVDGSGKVETANLLKEWMDQRHISTYAFDVPLRKRRNGRRCGAFGAPCRIKVRSISFLALGIAPMTVTGFHHTCFKLVDVANEIGNRTIFGEPIQFGRLVHLL